MEELLKQLLQAELDKVQKATPKAEPETPAAAPETPTTAFNADALRSMIEEAVQKAMPAAPIQRGEGAGSRQESGEPAAAVTTARKAEEALVALVAKARKPEELSQDEKRTIWALTYAGLRAGLRDDPNEM